MAEGETGWTWFDAATAGAAAEDEGEAGRETARAFARCFAGPHGQQALGHLRAITADRFLGPEAPDAALRHLEGQRQLVAYIAALAERGRSGG